VAKTSWPISIHSHSVRKRTTARAVRLVFNGASWVEKGIQLLWQLPSLAKGNWQTNLARQEKGGKRSHWFSHEKKSYLWDTRVPALDLRAVTVIVSISVSSSFPVLQISYPWKSQTLEANFPPQQKTEEKRQLKQLGKQQKPNCNDVSLHGQNIWQWIDTTITYVSARYKFCCQSLVKDISIRQTAISDFHSNWVQFTYSPSFTFSKSLIVTLKVLVYDICGSTFLLEFMSYSGGYSCSPRVDFTLSWVFFNVKCFKFLLVISRI